MDDKLKEQGLETAKGLYADLMDCIERHSSLVEIYVWIGVLLRTAAYMYVYCYRELDAVQRRERFMHLAGLGYDKSQEDKAAHDRGEGGGFGSPVRGVS